MTDFAHIKQGTQAAYDRKAQDWDTGRKAREGEAGWIAKLLKDLPLESPVLDLGCGTGKPMADYILGAGHSLTGLDNSPKMIAIAKANYPQATWQVADMASMSLTETYSAILSWDGFFHLTPQEQRQTLPILAAALRPNGRLLLTIGDGEGQITGNVYGETVYHGSLSHEEYTQILESHGLGDISITMYEPSGVGRIILMASKPAE